MPNFTTGPTLLADVGKLEYNGCVFSPFFETNVSGAYVKDNAGRTTKNVEYVLTVDGYATVSDTALDLTPTMATLRQRLAAQGGDLIYSGRGLDLIVNSGKDAAWGPIPKLLEFQPLGGGRSAKVRWQVTVHLTEIDKSTKFLQFNYETALSYGEDGFSSLSIRGTVEIPMSRPTVGTRTLTKTVDDFRSEIERRLLRGLSFAWFRPVRREFNVSRDKRTLEFDLEFDEKPYMDLPMDCTVARGTFNVRPVKVGAALATWLCTLKATYTVRSDKPRRTAWIQFLWLLWARMRAAEQPGLMPLDGDVQNPAAPPPPPVPPGNFNPISATLSAILAFLRRQREAPAAAAGGRKAWLIDFSFDEGLYLDSKTVSFSATWRLNVKFADILLASGLWRKVMEDYNGLNIWAVTMRSICGANSWLTNRLDPALDIIVDFGGGA